MDFLFAEEFECSPAFRAWFLRRIGCSGGFNDLLALGRSVNTRYGETDLLLVHPTTAGGRQAIMIENKVSAPFMALQAERYRIRGDEGIKRQEWDCFKTVLFAPKARLSELLEGAFDSCISYEEIIPELTGDGPRVEFKCRMLRTACGKTRTPWVASVDPVVTSWFVAARNYGILQFPDLPLPPEGSGRAPTSTWLMFYVREFLLSRVCVEIKPKSGVVDLRINGVRIGDLRRALDNQLPQGADTVEAGKSVSIRTTHAPADIAVAFVGQEETVHPMFASADRLLHFAQEKAKTINGLLGLG